MNNDIAQDKPSSDGTQERVTGPFKGYHVVALGCSVGGLGLGFRGFYKICRGHPDNYWTAESMMQGRCGPESSSGAGAMRMAETAAAFQIQGMAANGPNAGWGYGCGSMMPFLREQREARSGEQFRGDPGRALLLRAPVDPQPGGALADKLPPQLR